MSRAPFPSHAPNREDVVLRRALARVTAGRYVDVGTVDPSEDSVTRGFYDEGWRGVLVAANAPSAERLRIERPDDVVVDPAREPSGPVGLGEVLASAGWQGEDIHFLSLDVRQVGPEVLAGLDLAAWRPWIIVLVGVAGPDDAHPGSATLEPVLTAAGYAFCLFDGFSRFYVAKEHAEALAERLSYPAFVLDRFITPDGRRADRLTAEIAELRAECTRLTADLSQAERDSAVLAERADVQTERTAAAVRYWQTRALAAWASRQTEGSDRVRAGVSADELDRMRAHNHELTIEVRALEQTVSWRVTRPLRVVRRFVPRRGVR